MKSKFKKPPYDIKFHYPNNVIKKGTVIDATPVRRFKPIDAKDGVMYATRVELIKFHDKKKIKHIRFAYWRRSRGKDGKLRWRWASQTTWVFSINRTKQAINDAKKCGFF